MCHLSIEGGADPLRVLATDLVHDTIHLVADIANLSIPRWKNFLLCSKRRRNIKRLEHYRPPQCNFPNTYKNDNKPLFIHDNNFTPLNIVIRSMCVCMEGGEREQ